MRGGGDVRYLADKSGFRPPVPICAHSNTLCEGCEPMPFSPIISKGNDKNKIGDLAIFMKIFIKNRQAWLKKAFLKELEEFLVLTKQSSPIPSSDGKKAVMCVWTLWMALLQKTKYSVYLNFIVHLIYIYRYMLEKNF
jgi:hypothetical protein